MLKKLLLCAVITMFSLAVLSSCGDSEEPAAINEPEAELQAEQEPTAVNAIQSEDNARIVLGVHEYIGDNIAEIPYIEYDGETNHEIDSINRSINQGIRQVYEDIKNDAEHKGWIEIRSYLFTSEDYLQAVVRYCQYPIYGTEGNMFSINYDMKAKKSLSVADAMGELGMSQGDLEKEVTRLLSLVEPELSVTGFSTTGFLVDNDTNNITLLLEIEVENDVVEQAWKYLYSYTPKLDDLRPFDKNPLLAAKETAPVDKPSDNLVISPENGYQLRVNYFSNTYIDGYDDGELLLGYFDVEKSDSFYDAVFECIGKMEIEQSNMSVGSIPSEICEFLLISASGDKPSFEVFFYDEDKTVFFHGSMEYDSAVYVAKPDEGTYFSLKQLIGELRLGAEDFELAYEYSVYDILESIMLYQSFMMKLGGHYALVDESLNVISGNKQETDRLLSSINVSGRNGDYPSEPSKHMQITDANDRVIAWVYFDIEQAKMFICPAAEEVVPATLFGTYSITPDTLHYVEELLS